MTTNTFIPLRTNILVCVVSFNPLNAQLNPICHLLSLLGAHHILHVSRIRINVPAKYLTIIIIILHELGLGRPVPASSSLFKGFPSCLGPFCLYFSQISCKLKYWHIVWLACYPNTANCLRNVYRSRSLDAVLCYLIWTLVWNLVIVWSKSHFLRRGLYKSPTFSSASCTDGVKHSLNTEESAVKRIISWRQSSLYNLHQKTNSAICNDVFLSTYA
jgi:hypothetical protein